VIAFLLPPWYQAEAALLPPGEEETGLGISTLLRGMSVPGVKLPTQVTPADVFIAVLKSRRINQEIVERFGLKKVYKSRYMIDAINELLGHTRFKLTDAGSIQISVEDRDRNRAAAIANAYIELLDRFTREQRMTKGRRTRMFIQTRLAETKDELAAAESRLAVYQARNKAVALSPGMSTAVTQAARLYAQRMALQVRLGVVRSYSEGSDEEMQIRQELTQLDRELGSLPETGLELARLVRDVKVEETLFELLTAQFEDARIAEARDVVTVDVLDPATPPEKKSKPRRGMMIAAAFLLSGILGMGIAVTREERSVMPVMRVTGSR
jgi:uncharacterized protein involved in exopolysaccharide biosynthesis